MLLFPLLALALGHVFSAELGTNLVSQMTLRFANTLNEPSDVTEFYRDDALLKIAGSLPFAGSYDKGNFTLFIHRVERAFDIDSSSYKVVTADEVSGNAILETSFSGKWRRSNEPATLTLIHLLEWDTLNKKIITHNILAKNIAENLRKYRGRAEKLLWDLYWSMFRTDSKQLKDGTGPAWNKIADDFIMKIDMSPEDITSSGTTIQGKANVLEHMKKAHSSNRIIMKEVKKKMNKIQLEILSADESNVWAVITLPKRSEYNVLVHYQFNPAGKLASETITMASDLKPWQVYPFPFPTPTDVDEGSSSMKAMTYSPAHDIQIDNLDTMIQVGKLEMGDSKHAQVTVDKVLVQPQTQPISMPTAMESLWDNYGAFNDPFTMFATAQSSDENNRFGLKAKTRARAALHGPVHTPSNERAALSDMQASVIRREVRDRQARLNNAKRAQLIEARQALRQHPSPQQHQVWQQNLKQRAPQQQQQQQQQP